MQSIQLYIEGQRVDMFKDESVSITQSIKNVKDIDKIFTEFTKTFTLPASKTNNKIFKHYYNFDIVGGFDARTRKSATIELNHLPFKKGKVKLEGVDLKNNKAFAYRITFFGNTVELKDILGESKLSDLDLSAYTQTYSGGNVTGYLRLPPTSIRHMIVPLITHTQRLFYEDGAHGLGTGNLWYESGSGTSHHHGVVWNQLKFALRVNKIIEAIEDDFEGIEFSSDFFKNTSLDVMNDLFIWLHKKSGYVEPLQDLGISTLVDGWTPDTSSIPSVFMGTSNLTIYAQPSSVNTFRLSLSTSATNYGVTIKNGSTVVYQASNLSGNQTITAGTDFTYSTGTYTVIINAQSAITFTNISWYVDVTLGGTNFTHTYSTGSYTTNSVATFDFVASEQIPEIKIIDFLSGLFKMFNLVAQVEDDGTIYVDTLDNFYANKKSVSTAYDISEFIDVNSSQVNVALPYKEVSLRYEDTKTFLANRYDQLVGKDWGEAKYNAGQELDGSLYEVQLPFSHVQYERLDDITSGNQLDVQYGYFVDESQNAYHGKPLLFYPINIDTGGISVCDATDADNVPTSHTEETDVNLPFNSVSNSSSTSTANIHFHNEVNEWTGNTAFTGTLFENYYKNYLVDVFNNKSRLTKVKAYLPLRILLNFTLADRFDINGKRYKINSIETNLATGESNIELLNEL